MVRIGVPSWGMVRRSALGLSVLMAASQASAHSYKLGTLEIGHLWAKPVAKGEDAVIIGPLFNQGAHKMALVGATSPAATSVGFAGAVDGGSPAIERIDIPAGRPVSMAPWGPHVVLRGVKETLKKGDAVDVDLDFGSAGHLKAKVMIENEASD